MLCLSKLILAASFLIVDSEGFSPSVYTDKTGHPTIGYGYNLSVYSLMLYVCFLLVFSIVEFFDEDISDILIAHSKIKTKTNSFYA
ncbi:hypothetical protein [Helicobacter pylori]